MKRSTRQYHPNHDTQACPSSGVSLAMMLVLLGTLSGCNFRQGGTLAGGIVGAALGRNNPVTAVAGAVVGGMAGYVLGAKVDEHIEKQQRAKALEAASLSKPVTWMSTQDRSYVQYAPGPVTYDRYGCGCRPIYCKGQDAQGRLIDVVVYAHQNSHGQWVLNA
jgi:surface antigen